MPQPKTSAQYLFARGESGGAPADAPVTGSTDAAGAGVPAAAERQAAGPGGRQPLTGPRGWGQRIAAAWPLLAVLAVQAALSVRLLRADTAFQDEALYLWAGHLQWAHWLHGTPIPPFPYYFSGAPVIYPPLGALADGIGGLAGARVLSLVFMLGATGLAWGTAARLFGRRAAFFAAALFAVLGPTLHLGAFATYDAMALFLVALAAWLRGPGRGPGRRGRLDGGGRSRAGAGQRGGVLVGPVRCVRAGAGGAGRVAGRGRPGSPPGGPRRCWW